MQRNRVGLIKNEKLFIILFFVLLAAALVSPLTRSETIPALADYMNHLAEIVQAKLALNEGQFPIRVAPLEQLGYRYPLYQFYSPTSFLLGGFVYKWLTPSNPVYAFQLIMWLALFIGGFYMYRLAYWFSKSTSAAILAGIVYLISPYYVITVVHLGSFNEPIALGLLPFTLYYSLQRFLKPNQLRGLVQMSVGWYLMMTTHIVTFIYTSMFFGLFLLLLVLKKPALWRNLYLVGIGYIFACLLGCWFLAPAAYLHNYLLASNMFTDPKVFTQYHPFLSHLLFPSMAVVPGNGLAFLKIFPPLGWPILFAALICVVSYFAKTKIHNPRANAYLLPLLICFGIAFFMVWSPINIFYFLPKIFIVGEYSWRLLSQVIWIGALLFAWAICWMFPQELDIRKIILAIFLLVTTSNTWNDPPPNSILSLSEFMKNPTTIYSQNNYVLNFMKSTKYIDVIDDIFLNVARENDILKLNTPIALPNDFMTLNKNPSLIFDGSVNDKKLKNTKIQVLLNNKQIFNFPLKELGFHWDLTLPAVIPPNSYLEFKLQPATPKAKIVMDRIMLLGFINKSEKIDAQDAKKLCKQKGSTTSCTFNVNNKVKLIELPNLFYPNMLKITLNGEEVPYIGVLYQGFMVAGITPLLNQINKVEIQFVGLEWANHISWIGWVLWLVILIYTIDLWRKKKNSKV